MIKKDVLVILCGFILTSSFAITQVNTHSAYEPFEYEVFILPESVPDFAIDSDGNRMPMRITDPEILAEIKYLNNMVPPDGAGELLEIKWIPFANLP